MVVVASRNESAAFGHLEEASIVPTFSAISSILLNITKAAWLWNRTKAANGLWVARRIMRTSDIRKVNVLYHEFKSEPQKAGEHYVIAARAIQTRRLLIDILGWYEESDAIFWQLADEASEFCSLNTFLDSMELLATEFPRSDPFPERQFSNAQWPQQGASTGTKPPACEEPGSQS